MSRSLSIMLSIAFLVSNASLASAAQAWPPRQKPCYYAGKWWTRCPQVNAKQMRAALCAQRSVQNIIKCKPPTQQGK